MTAVAERSSTRPEAATGRTPWGTALTWSTPAVFGLCTAVGAVNPELGLLGLLLFVVLRIVEVAGPGSAGG